MRSTHMFAHVVTFVAATFLAVIPAQAYEAELEEVAESLITQLENANQQSGTVVDFTDLQGLPTELGRFLAQELSDRLFTAAQTISFVDRANLQYLLNENQLSADGLVDPESSRKLGNLIGIDTLVLGTTTPIGSKIRLSVRAINVETGRIVATTSISLPADDELANLFNVGVPDIDAQSTYGQGANLRTRIRPDSVVLSVDALRFSGLATLGFVVENRAGVGLWMAIQSYSITAGPCRSAPGLRYTVTNGPSPGLSGLPVTNRDQISDFDPDIESGWQWVPAASKVSGTFAFYSQECSTGMVSGLQSVPVSLTLAIADDIDALAIPLSVEDVPVITR